MISDVELDRILGAWLRDGDERAPAEDVSAAMLAVSSTRQRRGPGVWLVRARSRGTTERRVLVLAMAATALLALAIATAVGAGLRLPDPSPDAEPAPSTAELRPLDIENWAVDVSIPVAWSEVGPLVSEYRHFAGTGPEGHLSASHESPYLVTVCGPDCQAVEVAPTIPYSASAQLAALKDAVAAVAGSDAWMPLAPGVLPDVEGGARLDTRAVAADGREWRRVHIVGLRERNLVAVTWAQPGDAFDPGLLDAVLAALRLTEAPAYSDGDLVRAAEERFSMPVPGLWITTSQPTLDGAGLSGVVQFGDGEVLVSVGSPEGALGWCDPQCRVLTSQTSLNALEASIRDGRDLGPTIETMLDGETARSIEATPADGTAGSRRYVVALHDERPVALRIDTRDWDVARGIVDEMVSGFEFLDPIVRPAEQRFVVAEGRVELALSSSWQGPTIEGGPLRLGAQVLSVRVGSEAGTIVTCDRPAGPWELCREVAATTLEALAAAILPAPIADHGVGPPVGRRQEVTLNGEPSVVVRIQAYEYPARGGQEVVYIAAMHEGRPYLIRIRTTANVVRDLDSVIAGFAFLD
jgi:hypothetical protein